VERGADGRIGLVGEAAVDQGGQHEARIVHHPRAQLGHRTFGNAVAEPGEMLGEKRVDRHAGLRRGLADRIAPAIRDKRERRALAQDGAAHPGGVAHRGQDTVAQAGAAGGKVRNHPGGVGCADQVCDPVAMRGGGAEAGVQHLLGGVKRALAFLVPQQGVEDRVRVGRQDGSGGVRRAGREREGS
jgi:hypothetical protein